MRWFGKTKASTTTGVMPLRGSSAQIQALTRNTSETAQHTRMVADSLKQLTDA